MTMIFLSEGEFDAGLFDTVDEDGDGLINKDEYDTWDEIDL